MTPRPAKNLISFTNRNIENLPTPTPIKRKEHYTDSKNPGLRLEVSYTGNKQFFSRIQVNKRSKWFSPGCFPAVSAEQARQWFQNLKADINRRIPSVMKYTSDHITLKDAFYVYLEEWLKPRSKRWNEDESLFLRYCENIFDAKLNELDRRDVVAKHNEIQKLVSNRTANKAKTLIHRTYSYFIRMGYFYGANPAASIKNFPEGTRKFWIDKHKMPKCLRAIFSIDADLEARAVALLALCTGIRIENIFELREAWIVEDPVPAIAIPAEFYKTNTDVVIPLVRQAVEIIDERLAITGGGLLFPANSASGHRVDIRDRWYRTFGRDSYGKLKKNGEGNDCERCDIEPFGAHDLRSTLITWMEVHDVSVTIRRKMAGHAISGVDASYSLAGLKPVLEKAQKIVDLMFEVAELSMWPRVADRGERIHHER